MFESWRHFWATAALCAVAWLMWSWMGVGGLTAFGFGLSTAVLVVGLTTGYWIGTNGTTDRMVMELMRRLREHQRKAP